MPKIYGVKEKDLVVAHIVTLILEGKLGAGERIDRNEVARDLGISRVPIQEAMVQLEHDGIIATTYHRGCFVERFDEAAIREHHEIYGLLNAMVAERAAADPDPRILDRLERLTEELAAATGGRSFQEIGWKYRQTICDAYAGPRLYALIRASQSFVPQGVWGAFQDNSEDLLPLYKAETDAIRRHDVAAARAVNIERSVVFADIMLGELARSGVMGEMPSLSVGMA